MKSDIYSSIKKFLEIALGISLSIVICYFVEYSIIYNSIEVKSSGIKTVEYGASNYDVKSFIKNSNIEDISIKKDIDTSVVGKQKIIVIARVGDVVKEVPITVDVKDTTAPNIVIKEENVSLSVGDSFDFSKNLESVSDIVDGNISYHENNSIDEKKDTNYYTVYGEVNNNVAGVYPVTVKAVDKYGNSSSITYQVEVKEDYYVSSNDNKDNVSVVNYNSDYIASGDINKLIELAYSLVGSPYRSGGANPEVGFDCSGFVYYLYSRIGIPISRSSSGQFNDGVLVSYDMAQPGDILSWGYVDGVPTHSALYVGNGKMIHATNPSLGVIVSDVASWTRGSGSHVIAVRRI